MKATQLPSGSYRVQVVVGKDETGKRIVKSFTGDTADDAIFEALKFKNSIGVAANAKTMTVGQAFTQYITARDNVLSPATIRGYNIIKNTRLQSIMMTEIHSLTINDVQFAVNQDAVRLSHKSIKESVALLKSALGVQGVELNTKRIAIPPKKKRISLYLRPEKSSSLL